MRAGALCGAVALVACGSGTARTGAPATTEPINPFRTGHTLVIPHAGGDGLYPENTMFAYEQSMAMGGEVVDIDVSMTSDGVLVAFHDMTLDRTTDGTGRLDARTWAEVRTLDAGYDFARDGAHPYRGSGVRVPTAEALLRRFPTIPATIDLKDQRPEVAVPLCALLRSLGRTDDVYVGSDTDAQVTALREACPELHTSGTDAERRATRAARDAGDTGFVTRQLVAQPSYLADDGTRRITEEYLAFAHRHGIAVLTWVVDDPHDMQSLIDMGVDGIYTSRPDLLLELVGDR